jgi:hypothetical protein
MDEGGRITAGGKMQPVTTNQFSKLGDQVFDRFAKQFVSARRWRLMLEQRLAREDFEQIRAAMLTYLTAALGSPQPLDEVAALEQLLLQRDDLPAYTKGGMLAPTPEHTLEFNLLHRSVARSLERFALTDCVDGIDLPINVRVVYGAVDESRATAPFSSSKLHSDVWAGVPADAVVVVLPVLGDIDNLTIECCEMPPDRELHFMRPYDAYEQAQAEASPLQWYKEAAMQLGCWYMADVRLLHRTVRRRPEGVRVSIDFRLRYNDAAYRAMVPIPAGTGPDSLDTRIPYRQWLEVGTRQLLVFDETLDTARATAASSSPVNQARYHLVSLQ